MSGDSNGTRSESRLVDVLMPVAVDKAYTYRLPESLQVARGQFVEAPLGARLSTGVVWSLGEGDGANLKAIAGLREWPPLPASLIQFIDWVARWTLAPRGMVLRMAARAPETARAAQPRSILRATGARPRRETPARARALAAIAGRSLGKSALAAAAHCSTGVIDALIEEGAIAWIAAAPEPIAQRADPDFAPTRLEESQREAARALAATVENRAFAVTLLEGVTGSGKTEVYFEAVAA
ncbi:MAG TPA: primosomal protein N', partial [Roseiarcus sp.]|nr:primosomal protein N' [Roseiarcus sp.]